MADEQHGEILKHAQRPEPAREGDGDHRECFWQQAERCILDLQS